MLCFSMDPASMMMAAGSLTNAGSSLAGDIANLVFRQQELDIQRSMVDLNKDYLKFNIQNAQQQRQFEWAMQGRNLSAHVAAPVLTYSFAMQSGYDPSSAARLSGLSNGHVFAGRNDVVLPPYSVSGRSQSLGIRPIGTPLVAAYTQFKATQRTRSGLGFENPLFSDSRMQPESVRVTPGGVPRPSGFGESNA